MPAPRAGHARAGRLRRVRVGVSAGAGLGRRARDGRDVRDPRMRHWVTVVATVLQPPLAFAHHGGDDDSSGLGGMLLWIAAAFALAVIAILQWISSRRRARDERDDASG